MSSSSFLGNLVVFRGDGGGTVSGVVQSVVQVVVSMFWSLVLYPSVVKIGCWMSGLVLALIGPLFLSS